MSTVAIIILCIIGGSVIIGLLALAVWIWFAKKMFKHNKETRDSIESFGKEEG